MSSSARTFVRTVLGVASAALLIASLAGCGSSDKPRELTASEKKVATNISTYFATQSQGSMTKTQTDCLGKKLVTKAGVKKLKSSKIVGAGNKVDLRAATFDKSLADKFADSYLGCYDYVAAQAKAVSTGRPNVDEKNLESCMRKNIPDSVTHQLIVNGLLKKTDEKLVAKAQKGFTTCQQQATKPGSGSTSPSPSASN